MANNYLNIGNEFEKANILSNAVKRTYFLDLGTRYDSFTLLRGVIAGAVSISVSPSGFESWTSLLNGFISGIVYQIAVKIAYMLKIDDAMEICQTHGATAFYSLFSICLFHKKEGLFFSDVYAESS